MVPLYASDILKPTPVPRNEHEPRRWYLKNLSLCEPVWLSASRFLGGDMVKHLMRNKKPLAIGVKWQNGDAITNMEGALHTFLTPIVLATIHGDYCYRYGHSISLFPSGEGGLEQARQVLISGLVHMDFEYTSVMWEFTKGDREVGDLLEASAGDDLFDTTGYVLSGPISLAEKRKNDRRLRYERELRNAARRALLRGQDIRRFVTSFTDMDANYIDGGTAVDLIVSAVRSDDPSAVLKAVRDRWVHVADTLARKKGVLSLLLLFLTMLHQVRNEHEGLEAVLADLALRTTSTTTGQALDADISSTSGYVFTYSPPKIFVGALGPQGKDLLLALYAGALRHLSAHASLSNSSPSTSSSRSSFAPSMRIFAYGDFDSPHAIPLLKSALRDTTKSTSTISTNLLIMRSADLYTGPEGNLYKPPVQGRGCLLVIHNNSDGFGNNVENEGGMGSLDAVVGGYSSMAACLRRDEAALDAGTGTGTGTGKGKGKGGREGVRESPIDEAKGRRKGRMFWWNNVPGVERRG